MDKNKKVISNVVVKTDDLRKKIDERMGLLIRTRTKFLNAYSQAEITLEKAKADVIASAARIDELNFSYQLIGVAPPAPNNQNLQNIAKTKLAAQKKKRIEDMKKKEIPVKAEPVKS